MSAAEREFTALWQIAAQLGEQLERSRTPIVFAESCTGGLVAASLAGVAGISRWLCGSAVTYQERTKTAWLGVSPQQLATSSAVSPEVTEAMAAGALQRTPQAELAVAVTGHLGPGAPPQLDAVVYVAALWRSPAPGPPRSQRFEVAARGRVQRQLAAARLVLQVSMASLAEKKNPKFF